MRPWLPPLHLRSCLKHQDGYQAGRRPVSRKNGLKQAVSTRLPKLGKREFLTLCSRVLSAVEGSDERRELRSHDAGDGEEIWVRFT